MSSFKNFARKTQPLAWKIPTLPVEAKRKTPFDMSKDLKEGDQLYYISESPFSPNQRVDGIFGHYSTSPSGRTEIWAYWDGNSYTTWMPVDRVFLVSEVVGDTGIEPVTLRV